MNEPTTTPTEAPYGHCPCGGRLIISSVKIARVVSTVLQCEVCRAWRVKRRQKKFVAEQE